MFENKRKIGIAVTSNGNRIMGLIRVENESTISIHRPVVIVRGDFDKNKAEGDIVLSNFDSMIGLNIIDQIETMYVNSPAFYSFFEKEEKAYQNFHASSYDSIKAAFSERYAKAKANGNLDPKDQVASGTADFQNADTQSNSKTEKSDCGCKGKKAVQNIMNQFKDKFSK